MATWYAAKTLYRTTVKGKPKRADARYRGDLTLVEERVVLFRARSFAATMRKAEKEARAYAKGTHQNPYGQRVVTMYLDVCDVFKLFASPANGKEVYSRVEVVRESRAVTVNRLIGRSREPKHGRWQFEISAP